MFLSKKYKHKFFKPQFLPASFFTSILSVLFFCTTTTVFAASAPPYLTLSISTPTVNFQFNQAENAASAFKEDMAVVQYDTDNKTGFTAYVSSIDEDTSLNHTDSSVAQKITSITSPSNASSFNSKNWGYLADQASFNSTFKPIPKASQPDQALNISLSEQAKFFLHFGVKTGPDLPAGTYSKKILVTAITNYVPTSATFIPGPNVNSAIRNANIGHDVKYFKKSNSAPANLATATVVSAAGSDVPIYLWYDAPSKTVFWWSDADTVYANQDSSYMLDSLGDVEKIDMDGINTSRVKNMSYMFRSGNNLYKEINLASLDTSNVEDMSYMFATAGMKTMENLLPLDLSHFNTSKVKSMKGMFSYSFLPSLNIRNFDTSSVEDMSFMFDSLKYVTDLDLSGWNVKKVNNIVFLFGNKYNLKNLNLSGWELDSITNMDSMFSGFHELRSLNLTGFTTKNVTNMEYMFASTVKLADLDLSSFDTSKVTNMRGMFSNMQALNNINLSSFNTSNVTDMSAMFGMAVVNPPISSLDLSNFDTSNVTNMAGMFGGLSNLTELKIQSFNTKKVTNMYHMFYRTFMNPGNGILDISNFDTRNVNDMTDMFALSKLKTIYASPSFVTTAITVLPQYPFMNNTNLVGGNGTQYVHPNNGIQYAHIDTPGNPGYFTRKP